MHKTAYWLFPLIASAVAIFIVLFFIDIHPATSSRLDNTKSHSAKELVAEDEKTSWIGRLSEIRQPEYLYPINEVSLEMNPLMQSDDKKSYHLSVKLASSYDFFCLKQELEKTKLSYLLNQSSASMSVEIDSSDLIALNNLIEKLKMYQISATLSPFKKD